jgi:prepilin-type processing-associated H-X9-DG protein
LKTRLANRSTAALTRVEVVIILMVVGFLAFTSLSALSAAKRNARTIKCIDNLKRVGLNFVEWANDHGGDFPMQVSTTNGGTMELIGKAGAFVHFQALSSKLNPQFLFCPADRSKSPAVAWSPSFGNENLSYFVDLDAREGAATNILAGDRDLALDGAPMTPGLLMLSSDSPAGWSGQIHGRFGNLAFADGSVQAYLDAGKLRQAFQNTGVATNRLVLP